MDIDRDIQKARADMENVLGPNGGSVSLYWVDPDSAVQRADAPHRSRSDFIKYIAQPGNLSLLFGAAYSWFAIEASPFLYFRWRDVISNLRGGQQVVLYGLGLNSSSILSSDLLARVGFGSPVTSSVPTTTLGICESLHNVVIGSLVVCVAGFLPSYYATLFLIDVWDRRPIQFLGFAMLAALLGILGKITGHPSGVV